MAAGIWMGLVRWACCMNGLAKKPGGHPPGKMLVMAAAGERETSMDHERQGSKPQSQPIQDRDTPTLRIMMLGIAGIAVWLAILHTEPLIGALTFPVFIVTVVAGWKMSRDRPIDCAAPVAENPFLDWLPEVSADEVVVAPGSIFAEAHGNLWAFSLTAHQAAALSPEQVASFVRAVAAARGRQLSAHSEAPMLFYCWHDEQAVQLRFSLVSAIYGRLPFGCEVERAASLTSIVASFLDSPYHDGFPLSAASESDLDSEGDAGRPLPVWVLSLPSSDAPP